MAVDWSKFQSRPNQDTPESAAIQKATSASHPSRGRGGIPRNERSPEEQAKLDSQAESERQAKLKLEADALAAKQAQAKATLDKEAKLREQAATNAQLQAQQKRLGEQNLIERQKYQQGNITIEELNKNLSENRLSYLQDRANSGVSYSDKNIAITKGQIVDKKTGEVYSTVSQEQTKETDFSSYMSRPTNVGGTQSSNIVLPYQTRGSMNANQGSNLYVGSTKAPGASDFAYFALETPNKVAGYVGESYRKNLPALGIIKTSPARVTKDASFSKGKLIFTPRFVGEVTAEQKAAVAGMIAETATLAPLYATTGGYVFGTYESAKAFKQSMNPNLSPFQRGVSAAAGVTGFGLIGRGVSKGLLATESVVRPQNIAREVITTPEGQVFYNDVKVKPSITVEPRTTAYRSLLTDEGQGFVGQVLQTRTVPREVVSKPVGAGKLFFGEGKPVASKPRVDIGGNPKEYPYIFDEKERLVSSGITVTQRQGANYKKFSILQGTGKNLEGDIYSQLSPAQKKAFFGKTGVVVTKDTAQVGAGYSELTKAFRSSSTKEPFVVRGYGYGKKTTRAEAVSTATKVYEDPFIEVYQTKTNVKDITLPTKPNTRGVISVTGEVKVIKEPLDQRTNPGNFIKTYHGTTENFGKVIKKEGFNKDATSLTTNKDYAQGFANRKNVQGLVSGKGNQPTEIIRADITKQEFEKYKAATQSKNYDEVVIDKNAKIQIIKPITKEQVQTMQAQTAGIAKAFPRVRAYTPISNIPKMLGGTGLTKSIYAGQGTYERSVETGAIKVPGITKSVLDTKSGQEINQANFNDVKDIQLSISKSNDFQIPKQNIFEDQGERIIERERQDERQAQPQRQREELKQRPRQLQIQIPRSPNPLTPKIPPTRFSSGGGNREPRTSFFSRVKKAYDVVVFKRGKEVVIGKNLPEGRAKQLGTSNVLKSLRASFKLSPSGSTSQEDIDFKVPSNLFRKGKKDASRFVQLQNKRLSSRGETSEIIKIPKKSKKGKRKLSWF